VFARLSTSASESERREDLARRQWDNLDNLDAAVERTISDVEQSQVRSTLPDEISFWSVVDYIGAYAHWDIPGREVADSSRNLKTLRTVLLIPMIYPSSIARMTHRL
jgi:hypothetical protein